MPLAGLLIAAEIALWRRHFPRVASSIFAIAAIPICILVVWQGVGDCMAIFQGGRF
jgi:hypothetical protein